MNPLPLTPFEELMLWEDRPAYPFSVFVRVRLEGRVDRSSWEAAVQEATALHPLLRSVIEFRGRRPCWIETNHVPQLEWSETNDEPGDDFPPAKPLSLFNEIGLRFSMVLSPRGTDVLIQFHHACCDGGGFLSFLNDLLIAYALRRGETSKRVQLPEYDRTRLPDRNRFGLTWWKLLKMLPSQLHGLQGARQFMGREPAQLVQHQVRPDDQPAPPNFPSGVRHVFSCDATNDLRRRAQQLNVTTNELLTRELFLALIRWREEHGFGDNQEWIRMMVPMNLRSAEDRFLSAANVVSSVFLDRKGEDAGDPALLLQSIHDELELIRQNQLGLTFQFSLRLFRKLPGGIRRTTRADKCSVSCVFTNVGKILVRSPLPKSDGRLVAGDVRFESIQGLIPIRPHNCFTFCAIQYAGQLSMDLHYDPDVVTQTQARRLMELLQQQTASSLATV